MTARPLAIFSQFPGCGTALTTILTEPSASRTAVFSSMTVWILLEADPLAVAATLHH